MEVDMPVVAMRATSKTAHEKTDQLFIYTFESPEIGERVIVANLTNTYEVGDVAAIAQPGTFLPGVEIKPRKVFGIPSSGMALGKVEAELDADLTTQFDADLEPRTFSVTMTVEVEARYAEDCEGVARKAIKSGKGGMVSATPAEQA
ncbi:MAG: tRNA-binding EMAP/Myf-like protein [Myxococcota bacterium]|jgi:tRNA-binding EMAP/Myf-like protein